MDMNFDVADVFQDRLASGLGLDSYQYIMERVMKINVSTDDDFQRTFNGFYRVRRNEAWRKVYYELFERVKERVKNENPSFEYILTYMYEHTGNIEPSFSSKMLATICPENPIWDKYILKKLGMHPIDSAKPKRLKNAIEIYAEIEAWYKAFLPTAKAAECIAEFDRILPKYRHISATKKIDCIIWSMR